MKRLLALLAAVVATVLLAPLPAHADMPADTTASASTPSADAAANRLAGGDRYATARAVALASFTSSTSALVVSGESYPDALAASFLSGVVDQPLLLTERDRLTPGVGDTLVQLGVHDVQIIGGSSAVSEGVAAELGDRGFNVQRVAGNDRYETSRLVAGRVAPDKIGSLAGGRTAIVATGEFFADALAAGPVSGADGLPIVLTTGGALHPQAAAALAELGITRVVVVGGTAAVSDAVAADLVARGMDVRRVAGANRQATATALAELAASELGFAIDRVELARGDNFADALTGGARGAKLEAPVLLTAGDALGADATAFLAAHRATIRTIDVLGGTGAVPDHVSDAAIGGSLVVKPAPSGGTPANANPSTGGGGSSGGGSSGSAPTPSTSTTTTPVTVPAPATAGTRSSFLWPFSSDSPWNTAIGSGAQFASTADTRTQSLLDSRSNPWINAGQYSQAIYQASITDPIAIFRRAGHADVSFRVPSSARPASGSDAQLDIVDPTGHYVDESWGTSGANPLWTTGYHVRNDLYGPGVGAGGVRAYGGSAIGGLIRTWEVEAGTFGHALALGIDGYQLRRGFVWPATAEDGDAAGSYGGGTPMGTLAAIPSSVNLSSLGLTRAGLALARTLQTYGAYVVDRSGCTCLYAEPDAASLPALSDMTRDFAKLRGQLRVVANNGPSSVGGGGTPLAPPAPPLG